MDIVGCLQNFFCWLLEKGFLERPRDSNAGKKIWQAVNVHPSPHKWSEVANCVCVHVSNLKLYGKSFPASIILMLETSLSIVWNPTKLNGQLFWVKHISCLSKCWIPAQNVQTTGIVLNLHQRTYVNTNSEPEEIFMVGWDLEWTRAEKSQVTERKYKRGVLWDCTV